MEGAPRWKGHRDGRGTTMRGARRVVPLSWECCIGVPHARGGGMESHRRAPCPEWGHGITWACPMPEPGSWECRIGMPGVGLWNRIGMPHARNEGMESYRGARCPRTGNHAWMGPMPEPGSRGRTMHRASIWQTRRRPPYHRPRMHPINPEGGRRVMNLRRRDALKRSDETDGRRFRSPATGVRRGPPTRIRYRIHGRKVIGDRSATCRRTPIHCPDAPWPSRRIRVRRCRTSCRNTTSRTPPAST